MSKPFVTEVDIAYASPPGGDLLARIYRPVGPSAGVVPGVVAVHGGAWTSGDRLDNAATSRALAASGAVVMDIDFRLPPGARFPEPVADINLAIRWLKRNAAELGLDPGHVGGLGFSSGGHQLALTALRPRDPRWASIALPPGPAQSADLAFLVLVYAVLDPLARYQMAVREGRAELVASHHAYWPEQAAMELGSPLHMVARGEAQRLPRALVVQGVHDENLTPDMADRFGAAYRAAGGPVEVLRLADAPHRFLRLATDSAAARQATARIIEFVHAFVQDPVRAAGQPAVQAGPAGDPTT